jgi:hypothetical protein
MAPTLGRLAPSPNLILDTSARYLRVAPQSDQLLQVEIGERCTLELATSNDFRRVTAGRLIYRTG